MGRYTGPKHKRSRREGVDLFGNGGESLHRRLDQPPGAHGREAKYRRRRSDYDHQLREKQKVKRIYGMRERQFRRFYGMAQKAPDLTGEALLALLERRLDNVVYRMGWARTRPQARQFVTHGHVLVDGKRVNIPSYLVKPGQTVALGDKARRIPDVQELLDAGTPAPAWMDRDGVEGRVLRDPDRNEITGTAESTVDEQLVVEFYSR
ncbi:MAG: 30S ribosomal protein S4 [Anaerolineae bacterium]